MNKLFFAIILFSAIVVWHFPVIKNYLTPSSIDSLPDLSDIDFDKHNLKNNPKLAAFYQWTKEDPLFTSPDFDSESFAKTIDALEQEEKALLSAIASPDPLFPISFLKRVSETNKIYKEFLASPSIDSGKNLISSYLVLRNSYSQNLENLEKVLENRKLFSLKPNFIGLGTTTTLQVTKEDLEKLRQNAKKLEEEIKNRETCLVSGKQCQRPASSFSRKPSAEEEITFSQNDFLPKEILLPKIDRDVSLFGPYVVSTDCFGWSEDLTKKTYPFYLTGEQVEKRDLASQISFPSQTSKLATTNYYRRLRETSPADKPFLDEGYAWVSQNETNPYMCPDNSYLTTLSSLDKFYRTYRNSPLFITLDNLPKEVETVLKEGADFEEKFFKSRVPSNGSAENLSNYYAYTYREIGEWEKNQSYQEKPWLKELTKNRVDFLNRYLEYSRKLSNFNLILGRVVNFLSALRIVNTVYSKKDYTYIYGFRNAYSLVYFPFSSSFYRLGEPLNYLEKKTVVGEVGFNGTYLTYQQALTKFSKEEIAKWNVDQNQVLQESFEKYKAEHH